MTKKDYIRLKRKLPKGWAKKMAARTGFSERFIRYVARGEREHREVLNELIRLANAEQLRKKTLSNKIKNL